MLMRIYLKFIIGLHFRCDRKSDVTENTSKHESKLIRMCSTQLTIMDNFTKIPNQTTKVIQSE